MVIFTRMPCPGKNINESCTYILAGMSWLLIPHRHLFSPGHDVPAKICCMLVKIIGNKDNVDIKKILVNFK